ncbi:ABC transporter substrate-binding protein [Lacticaseibacillus porcinae]|uniref:ABC transporter substrate-binding protein n=1 Tax=Lacticaseibacillus porcinae TaxID=1123687 RepID=UPI0013DDA2C4|nr:extracellular solute-binding protein [Lacticaseibacillus porcinae]
MLGTKHKLVKSVVVGAALLGGAMTMTACSSSSSSSSKTTTVDFYNMKVEFKDQLNAAAATYNKTHKGVKVKVTSVGGGTDYQTALKAKMQSGKTPDIFALEGPQQLQTYKKYLSDVSSGKAIKKALPGTLNTVKSGSQVLGYPVLQEAIGIVYNKTIFQKAGIDASKITTMAAYENALQTLNDKKSELGIEAATAFPMKEWWVIGQHAVDPFLSQEFNGSVTKAYNAKTISWKNSDYFKQYIDATTKYSAQPVQSMDYSTQIEKLFSTGKVAMAEQGTWVYPTIESVDKNLAKNIGIIPIPVNNESAGKLPVGVTQWWAVNKQADTKTQKASRDFLDWLFTSKEGKNIVLTKLKVVPAYSGFDSSKISDPLGKDAYSYISDKKTQGLVFGGFATDWAQNGMAPELQKYVAGKESWNTAIKNSEAAWKTARAGQ